MVRFFSVNAGGYLGREIDERQQKFVLIARVAKGGKSLTDNSRQPFRFVDW